jgi:hypothetical protein
VLRNVLWTLQYKLQLSYNEVFYIPISAPVLCHSHVSTIWAHTEVWGSRWESRLLIWILFNVQLQQHFWSITSFDSWLCAHMAHPYQVRCTVKLKLHWRVHLSMHSEQNPTHIHSNHRSAFISYYQESSPQGPTFVGTGSGAPKVPELHSAQGYNWATRPQGDINYGYWPSRFRVGHKASDLILENTSCCEVSNKSDLSEKAKTHKGL